MAPSNSDASSAAPPPIRSMPVVVSSAAPPVRATAAGAVPSAPPLIHRELRAGHSLRTVDVRILGCASLQHLRPASGGGQVDAKGRSGARLGREGDPPAV